jgi:hypothetical protein
MSQHFMVPVEERRFSAALAYPFDNARPAREAVTKLYAWKRSSFGNFQIADNLANYYRQTFRGTNPAISECTS